MPREALGTMIGRYKLLQEIGEGGFGIVYLAEQKEPVKRKVRPPHDWSPMAARATHRYSDNWCVMLI